MRHLGLQRVIINLLLPRGHSCVTIKMTHIQLSGSWPHLQVWWTLLWGWLNLQLFRMAACFPQQILSDVYLTDLKPRKSIINCFKRDFNSFSLPKPGNTSSHQNLKACPAWAQLCLQIRIHVKIGLYCLRLLLYSGLNKMCNKVHLINTGGNTGVCLSGVLIRLWGSHLPPGQHKGVPGCFHGAVLPKQLHGKNIYFKQVKGGKGQRYTPRGKVSSSKGGGAQKQSWRSHWANSAWNGLVLFTSLAWAFSKSRDLEHWKIVY